MTAVRGDCVDCRGDYALRSDGLVRVHGITSRGPCSGSMKPPAARPQVEPVDTHHPHVAPPANTVRDPHKSSKTGS